VDTVQHACKELGTILLRYQGMCVSCRWASSSSGSPNYEMDERSFLLNRETAVSYLNSLHHVFVFDGFANWDPEARIKVTADGRGQLTGAYVCSDRCFHSMHTGWVVIVSDRSRRARDARVCSGVFGAASCTGWQDDARCAAAVTHIMSAA
jgi:hypothetical protein